MTRLVRRDPFDVIPSVGQIFSQFFDEPLLGGPCATLPALPEGTLPLDISEDDKSVIVRASVPGFRREDISVELHEGVLTIKAEHTEETEASGERYFRRERRTGALTRRVALPSTVVEGETQAELKEGVLTLRVPKSARAMPRKIQIG